MIGGVATNKNKLYIALLFSIIILILTILCFNFEIVIPAEDITIEYGEQYTEPEVISVFRGKVLAKDEVQLKTEVSGIVNEKLLGKYRLTYSVKYIFWNTSKTVTVTIVDTTPPEITLDGDAEITIEEGAEYSEPGYTAFDKYDEDITDKVSVEKTSTAVIYTVSDSNGNKAEAIRKLNYIDTTKPSITLTDSDYTMYIDDEYKEPGYSATDNIDGDITDKVTIDSNVDIHKAGTYTITYTVSDSSNNTSSVTRNIIVKRKIEEHASVPETVQPNGKTIYLTFDDGPGKYTQQLLDVLKKYDVKVTFFVVNNSNYTDLITKEYNDGHSVGIHSASHDYSKIYSSKDAYFEDLYKMQNIIYDKTGEYVTIMRFPGGSSNTVSRKYCNKIMTTLTTAVNNAGFQYFDWNVSSGDAGETTNTQTVVNNVISGIKKHDASVVLQHDIKGFSVNAVEQIIKWGLDNGYTFKALDMTSPAAHHSINN